LKFGHLTLPLAALAFATAFGNAVACAPDVGAPIAIAKLDANNTIHLVDGRQLRARGILIPTLPRNAKNIVIRRAARAANKYLHAQLDGKRVLLSHLKKPDRHGRIAAHLYVADDKGGEPVWLQQAILAAGHARQAGDGSPCWDELRAAEALARSTRRGLWVERAFRVRKASHLRELFKLENTFQIVEGQVRGVAETKRTLYLNFGAYWRRDFTIAIRNRAIVGKDLAGAKVRVRGWIMLRNGPLIEVTIPPQLEILGRP
jgi:micrococcal nuclease